MPATKTTARKFSFSDLKPTLVRTYQEWSKDQAPRLGAALAYYTTLSLAPLLLLLLALAGLIFGDEAAKGQISAQAGSLVGPEGAKAIEEIIQNASKPGGGILASFIGFATLIFGASSVAGELKNALNSVWNKDDSDESIKDMITKRSTALVIVLACGFLLLVSLTVSSAVAAAGSFLTNLLPVPEIVMHALLLLVSLAVITGVFALLFRYLPDVNLTWSDVLPGAAFTAVLFTIGKFLIGLYLGKASFGSTYGAAGSLVIVLVWVYYSAQILFFGAEFTQVYSAEFGSDPQNRRGRAKGKTTVQASPKPVVAGRLARESAGGGSMLPTAPPDKATGIVGTLIGSALAITRAVRGAKR